jgi:integrase
VQHGSLKVVKDRHGVKCWRCQWRENGHGRTRILGKFADMSRADADAERRKILAPLTARREAETASAVTLTRYVEDEYLTVRSRNWKASTRATTEQIIRSHILADLGSRALASITRRELQEHLDRKADAGLSFSVVAHVHWQLVAIFKMARADGVVTINPAEGLITPRCKDAPGKRIISLDAIRRAQMVLEIRERLIFRLAVSEGMRPGEIVGLQVGDFRDGMIHVERRIYRGKVDSPKSRRSRRPIPPTDVTGLLLGQWLDLLQDNSDGAWLFPSETGNTPLSYSNVFRRRIQPALAKVGLGAVNFQVLRRTWVTEFSQVERDPNVRAQLAGHSVDVDANVYNQPQAAVLRRSMKRMGKHLQ